MAKKEFPELKGDFAPKGDIDFGQPLAKKSGISNKISGKVSDFSNTIFGVIKLILGICLLPFVYSSTVALLREFGLVEKVAQDYFWLGVNTFLVIYLFIWEPQVVYLKGQKLLEIIFSFFKPLVKVAPYLLPIYTIVLFVVYGILGPIIKSAEFNKYAIFLIGLSFILHLAFSAKTIQGKKGDPFKATYIFGFSFVYIVDLVILAFCFNLIFKEFSFVSFFNNASAIGKNIFYAGFKQLFLR